MSKRPLMIAALSFVSMGVLAQAASPEVALKLDPETDHVAPLPLDTKEAARRFGLLDPGQTLAINAVNEQLFHAIDTPGVTTWSGPDLMLSHSRQNRIEKTDLAGFRTELSGTSKTVFDPYSLGHRGDVTYAVTMVRMLKGSTESWVAVAFILKGSTVQRIVVAPQPWMTLLPSGR